MNEIIKDDREIPCDRCGNHTPKGNIEVWADGTKVCPECDDDYATE